MGYRIVLPEADYLGQVMVHVWSNRVFSPAWSVLAEAESAAAWNAQSEPLLDALAGLRPSPLPRPVPAEAKLLVVSGHENIAAVLDMFLQATRKQQAVLAVVPSIRSAFLTLAGEIMRSCPGAQLHIEVCGDLLIATVTWDYTHDVRGPRGYRTFEELADIPISSGRRDGRGFRPLPAPAQLAGQVELRVNDKQGACTLAGLPKDGIFLHDDAHDRPGLFRLPLGSAGHGVAVARTVVIFGERQASMLSVFGSAQGIDAGVVLTRSGDIALHKKPTLCSITALDSERVEVSIGVRVIERTGVALEFRAFPSWSKWASPMVDNACRGSMQLLAVQAGVMSEIWGYGRN
jgi:hypothetical protein